jgi:putative phosphoesterase
VAKSSKIYAVKIHTGFMKRVRRNTVHRRQRRYRTPPDSTGTRAGRKTEKRPSDQPAIGYHETARLSSEKYDFSQKASQALISWYNGANENGGNGMKWMIASDLHGSAYYGKKMVEAFEREGAGRLLLLGDLLYHGPRNDLPRDYAPKEVIPLLNSLKNRLCCIRGNCDAEVDQMVLDFPVLADYCVLPVGETLIYATHGHIYHLENLPPLAEGDILLHGHTHVPAWTEFGQGNVYLNPGSLSIPKENSPHSYMTLEDGVFYWKNVDTGEIYHTRVL